MAVHPASSDYPSLGQDPQRQAQVDEYLTAGRQRATVKAFEKAQSQLFGLYKAAYETVRGNPRMPELDKRLRVLWDLDGLADHRHFPRCNQASVEVAGAAAARHFGSQARTCWMPVSFHGVFVLTTCSSSPGSF